MPQNKIRILYIDDYPLDRALVRDALQESELAFQITEAANQEEFLQLLSKDFDLVLSDFNILGFTGLAVLEAVREVSPTLPVVIVTGTGSEEIAAEAIKRGAADYVIKSPQHIHHLPLTIQSVLEKTQLQKERRIAYQKLVESEARYSQLVETLQEGIWTLDSQAVTTFVNPAMAEMLGYEVDEMLGRSLFDFVDQASQKLARQNFERRKQGLSDQHDFVFLHRNGTRVHTNIVTSPITDQGGEFLGAVAAVRDISLEIEAEQALQNSRLELQTLVNNTPGSIWTVDKQYCLVSANQKFIKDLEKTFEKPIRKGYQLFSDVSREEKREWKIYYDRALSGEKFQLVLPRHYGESGQWYEYYFSPLFDDSGKIQGVMVEALDITDRKNSEILEAESREKYRKLVDQVGAALFLHDMEGNLVEVNQQSIDRYGYSREELLSLSARDIDPDYDQRAQGGNFWEELFQEPKQRFIGRHQTKDGTIFPVEVVLNPVSLLGEDFILALATDISDQVETQHKLAESEAKYRTLTEKSPAAIMETDAAGNCVYVNEKWREISGMTAQEAAGKGWIQSVHPQDRERIQKSWYHFVKSGTTWSQEYKFKDREGASTWVQGEAVPLKDKEGQINGYLGTNTIISDRVEMEQRLEETNRTLDALLGNLPGMAFRCRNTPDWDMLFVSEGSQDLTGYAPGELTAGNKARFGDLIHPEDLQTVWDSIQEAFSKKQPYRIQYRITRRDGELRWVQEQGEATKTDREGNVIELEGFIQDITGRVQASRDLESTTTTLTTVLDSIDAHIYVSDLETYEILYMNDKMVRDFGGDLRGQICYQSFRGNSVQCVNCSLPDLLDADGNHTGPHVWEGRNEITGRWYLNTDRAIPWTDQRLVHIQIAVDIHQRKLVEQALQESNQQLLLAQQIAKIGNWSLDPQVGVPVWSDEIYRIYERDPEQGPHPLENYQNIYQGPFFELFNESIQAAIHQGKPYDIQLRLELDSGTIKWIRAICQPDPDPGPAGHILQGTIQDITENKLAEQALQESEERFRSSFENTQVGMALIDRQGKFLSVNQAACSILKYTQEELLGKTYLEITHPDNQKRSNELFQNSLNDHQPYHLEKKYLTKQGHPIICLTSKSPVLSSQGEFLYSVAHMIDITQEKQVEEEIRSQQEFYNQIISNVQDGIWVTNHDDRMIYFNPAMEAIAGVKTEDMLGLSVVEDFPSETTEHFIKYYQEAKESGDPKQYGAPVVTPAGRKSYQAGWLIPRVEEGKYQGMICTIQDITEQQKNARELAESESKFRLLFENMLDGFALHQIVLDQEGQPVDYIYLEANQAFEKMTGLKREQIIGKKVTEVLPGVEDDPADWIQTYGRVALNGEELRFEQYSEPLDRWYSVLAYSPAPNQFATIFEDITAQKQADTAIRESEARYRTLFESALEALVIHQDGRIVEVNQTFLKMYRCTQDQVLGSSPLELTAPDSLAEARERMENPQNSSREFSALRPDGSIFPILLNAKDITFNGKPARLVSIRDITSLRTAEQSLRMEKQRTQQYLDVADIMLLALDTQQRVQTINPKGCELLGYPEDKILGKNWFDNFLDPTEISRVKEVYDRMISGDIAPVEYFENQIVRPDGSLRLIAWHNSILRNETGEIIGVFSSGEDITDRRAAEIELLESKETAESYLNIAAEIILSLDREGTITLLNPSGHRLLGYQPGELIGKNWIKTCLPKDMHPQSEEILTEMLADNTAEYEVLEGKVVTKTGEIKTILWHNSVIRDDQGKVVGTLSSGEDITRQAEILEDLTHSRHLLYSLSQAARQIQNLLDEGDIFQTIGEEIADLGFNISIFSLSEDGKKLNQKYTSFDTGILKKASQVTGVLAKDFSIELKPGSYFSQVLENNKTYMGSYDPRALKEVFPHLSKRLGETLRKILGLERAIFAPLIADDQILGLIIVLGKELDDEDVPPIALFASQASTALRNARYAEALRLRTEELEKLTTLISETEEAERKRLSQELHDQVGQSLALLGFNLNQVKDQLKKSSDVDTKKIENAQQILNEVTAGIRSVMDDLRPAILDDYGLLPALHWYADKISEHAGLEISVDGKSLTPRLVKRGEVALFRITQEALTNITRHARASRVELKLEENKASVILTIRDNGIGFDPLEIRDQDHQQGWGLINMQERAARIGGTLEIQAEKNKGTQLKITVPRE